ncbi:MAG: DUF1326 domain-containing protein [Acidobacteriota bacterium]|nr:DUF1326 domain-containing protein [Acidobacteriota bacterium]
MRRVWFAGLAISALLGGISFGSSAESVSIRGDYVEVRTASVFAGACHYNGEVTTTGRDALMAWNVTSGKWNGVDLAGVRALAVVTSESNLSDNDAARHSEIIIDGAASHSQAVAMLEILKSRHAASLGKIVAVLSAPIAFEHKAGSFAVTAGKLASINVEAMPNDLCCKMPNLVWYSPLVPLTNRKVGYTTNALYSGDSLGEPWQRSGENSAFYGSFAF